MSRSENVRYVLLHRGFSDPLLSLRGIAAVAVLIFHSMLSFKIAGVDPAYFRFPNGSGPMLIDQLVVFLANGGAAVTFFFVHSGFVLSLSLDKSKRTTGPAGLTVSFYVKRLFRLYPVVVVASFVGLAVVADFRGATISPMATAWYHGFFSSATVSLKYALLSALSISPTFNQFAWSLRIEFLVSVLMPLLFFAMLNRLTAALFLLGLYALWKTGVSDLSNGYVHGYFATYLLCFVAGFAIGKLPFIVDRFYPSIRENEDKAGRLCDRVVALSLIPLLIARPLLSNENTQLAVMIEAIASMPIIFSIYYIAQGGLYRFCSHKVVCFLGSISYSLYMLGSASIYIAVRAISRVYGDRFISAHGLLANISATLLALTLVVIASSLCYKYVEIPPMNFGKWLGDQIGRRL